MKLGLSLRSAHTFDDPRRGAELMVRRADAAARAGLDSLFVGDHHAVGSGYYQNVPMLGRLLATWPRTAGALFVIPLWHPVLLAEQVATLASLAPDRFVLQCAVGYGPDQFAAMGHSLNQRAARFEEGLEAVRRLLQGEEVTVDGAFRFGPARIGPLPPDPIDVWIGGHAQRAIQRAARMGDGWIAGPEIPAVEAGKLVRYYRERCAALGIPPGPTVIRRDVHVGRDANAARSQVEPIVAAGYRGFDPQVLVYGGPDEVTGKLAELGELGFSDVLIRHIGGNESRVLESFERLGSVRQALASL